MRLAFSLIFKSKPSLWLLLAALGIMAACTSAFAADAFPYLDTGVQVYSNVTVTSKSATHVFIKHSKGFAGLKVNELNHETLVKLGYEEAPKEGAKPAPAPNASDSNAAVGTTGHPSGFAASLEAYSRMREKDPRLPKMTYRDDGTLLVESGGKSVVLDSRVWLVAIAFYVFLYLFWSACSMAICRKCGVTGGFSAFLCWLGWLRIIPLLRAAGMSAWWFFVLLIPGLNLVIAIVWCIKIVNARGKGGFTALFLLFVPTFPLAFLYLAASGTGQGPSSPPPPSPADSRRIQLTYQH